MKTNAQDTRSADHISSLAQERATESNALEIPAISLPKGGGALKGIDEKFAVNAANGTAGFSISLPVTPGRNGFAPSLTLSYNSGGGNSPYGLGWSVGYPMIQRKTDKQLPRYRNGAEEDTFMFSGVEDLVPYLEETANGDWIVKETTTNGYTIRQYRPRIEGGFARIEKIQHERHGVYWKVTTGENVVTIFGRSRDARMASPTNDKHIFQWMPEFSYDDQGNWIRYHYKTDTNLQPDGRLAIDESIPHHLYEKNRKSGLAPFTNTYLKRITYGNRQAYYADAANPYDPQQPADEGCFFELVMDYGEHDEQIPTPREIKAWTYRPDAFSTYRSGFEIRTNRLCKRILMFHHFEEEQQADGTDFGENYLVRSLDLSYQASSINQSGQTEVSYLQSIIQKGYIRKPDGSYSQKALPPLEFTYEALHWNTTIKTVSQEATVNAPVGLTNNYQWVDLYGEGISGIFTEQGEGWYYKSNLGGTGDEGDVAFTVAQPVMTKPTFMGLSNGVLSVQDLGANGEKQIVINSGGVAGYFELGTDQDWHSFKPFEQVASVNLQDPNTRLIDLNGDGQPELVMTEEQVFVWYPAAGKRGHQAAEFAAKTFDEERGPAILFADQEQTIFLADMSGDGLTDIVRIRNGEICYWANMGYGKFSARIAMDNPPLFDYDDHFNPQLLHLADVSGTGATDIIYLGKNKFKAYINLSGNAWSDAHEIEPFFPMDGNSRLSVVDLLGTGTSCIVWSSDLPAHAQAPMRYIDLMDSKKPHLLIRHQNNMGKETTIEYKSSSHFYLADKAAGKPWITKLPFPVQVIHKMILEEKITDVRFTTEYRYHHGYYDHPEREFRGFGMVEQLDTEHYNTWRAINAGNQMEQAAELFQPPMLTKTWFHTGAFLDRARILSQFEKEYWYELYNQLFPTMPLPVSEPTLKDAVLKAADSISNRNIIDQLSAAEWREALRACKGMTLRQEVFALDAPEEDPSLEALQKQAKPYSVATHNCHIQLLQPRAENSYGVFIVTESEAISIQYEREETDPRMAHSLNLKIDELGNVLEAAAVVYPRLQPDLSLPVELQREQSKTFITFSENRFTNDVLAPDAYRLRVPAEAKSYELTNIARSGPLYQLAELENIISQTSFLAYQASADETTATHRLIEQVRSLFYRDDLTGPLPLGNMASSAIPYESYQLAYTPELLTTIYGNKIDDPEATMADGRFVHLDGDDNWWIRSGLVEFMDDNETIADVRNRFYTPLAYTDPFGSTSRVTYYKDYFLLMQGTEDELGNQTKVERYDFRSLSPSLVRDINDNLSEVLTDELGLVKAVALLGKDLDGDNIPELERCDELDNLSAISETESATIQAFFETENSNQLHNLGAQLLQGATSRFVYDFDRYIQTGQPIVAATIVREQHFHTLAQNETAKLQVSFEYTDGLGNVAMVKAQAEPGLALQALMQPDGTFQINEINTATDFADGSRLRWIGNGRTVLNNKGNPVKQYEPYFSPTPHYETAPELVETGVTPTLYYDAPGRLVKTELPDETFTKVEFDAWKQLSYDQNDTVVDSQWYAKRINSAINTERTAAEKAAKHHGTPTVVHLDPLGRPVLSVEHNRIEEKDPLGNVINNRDEFYPTFIQLDIEGNAREIIDARGNRVMAYQYDMLGHRVYENSMDKGERWMLNNVMGNPVKNWDSKGQQFTTEYDVLQRPVRGLLQPPGGAPQLIQQITYGEGQANDKVNNLRGQVVQNLDSSGSLRYINFDLKGNLLKVERQFPRVYEVAVIDWAAGSPTNQLEAEVFTAITEYDALNRMSRHYNWHRSNERVSVYEPNYNERGVLQAEELITAAQKTPAGYTGGRRVSAVFGIRYDEKGQRQQIRYGNGTRTKYHYDPLTYRLVQMRTTLNGNSANLPTSPSNLLDSNVLQNLYYTYDPVGNITEIEDDAYEPVFFQNQPVRPKSTYTYDALYRLVLAKGRENHTFNNAPTAKEPNPIRTTFPKTDQNLRNYTQCYAYDAVGNILEMRHQVNGSNNGWTRRYTYAPDSNRLIQTRKGTNLAEIVNYNYDEHGNMLNYNNTPAEFRPVWDYQDRVHRIHLGGGGDAFYQYDAKLERSRKVVDKGNGIREERLYLGGMEVYRRTRGNTIVEEIETHHLFVDDQRVLIVEEVLQTDDNNLGAGILDRYQYSNHLGSVGLEADGNGAIISYEEYHPYGTVAYQAVNSGIRTTAKRYRYTGMERDAESGLNYHSARYYLPWLGRWLSGDPIGIGDGMNLYLFLRNNPIIFSDPTGTQSVGLVNVEDTSAKDTKKLTLPVSTELDPFVKLSGEGVDKAGNVRLSQIKSASNYIDNFVSAKGYGSHPFYPRHVGIRLTYQDGSTLDVPFTAISTSDKKRTKEFQYYEGKWYPVSTETGRGKAKLNLENTPVLASIYNYFNDQGRESSAINLFYAQLTVEFVIPIASGALGSTGTSGIPFKIPKIAPTTLRGFKVRASEDTQVLGNVTDAEINAAFNNRELGPFVSAPASKTPLTPNQIEKYGPQRGGQNSNIWFHDNLRVPRASPSGGVVFIRTHSANPGAPVGAFSRSNYTTQIHDRAGRYLLPNGSWKRLNQMTAAEKSAAHIPAGN